MKAHTAASLILVALAATSCGGRKAVEINPNTVPLANRWNGTLTTPAELSGVVDMRGSAWMGPDDKNADRTRAGVDVYNAVPGGVHPWHVHRGRCGADQGVMGPAEEYPLLKVGQNGRASAEAQLSVPSPRTGEYSVNVHASPKNMRTIVACGNLAPPAR
jgi:hypothetical protein